MIIPRFFVLLLLAAFLSFGSILAQNAWAQTIGLDLNRLKPLTKIEFMPAEEFYRQTVVTEDIPYEDKHLAYQLRLPKGWKQMVVENKVDLGRLSKLDTKDGTVLSQRVLGAVARYVSAPKDHLRSYFTIEAQELTYEISARNWFINYIVQNGLTLEQVGEGDENEVEAIYINVEGDQTYVVRVRAIKNGGRMIIARYAVPASQYEQDRVQQAQVLDSFRLTNKENTKIEELETYGFLDQSFFFYPESWSLSAPFLRSINRMRATVYHSTTNQKLDGQIKIFLTNKDLDSKRSDEVEFYKKEVQVPGYALGGLIEKPEFEYHPDMVFGITEAYEYEAQELNLLDYELWFSFLESDQYFYVVTLLTPARHADFYTWARNIEAYRIVLKEVRRTPGELDVLEYIDTYDRVVR
jgi:hypothetical protein